MQKALSCANVNDKPVNPLKLMAYTTHAALVGFTCKFVCKVFEHFVEHDIPLISIHVWFQWQGLALHISSMPWGLPCTLPCFPNTFTRAMYLAVSRTAEGSKRSL